jgi:site-specific recombinase XerD
MSRSYREHATAVLRPFLRYLGRHGVIPAQAFFPEREDPRRAPGHDATLSQYSDFLTRHRGLAPVSVQKYLFYAARLCRWLGRLGRRGWDEISPDKIYAHLAEVASSVTPRTVRDVQATLRSFFRFLHFSGKSRKDWSAILVPFRTYSLSTVPKMVPPEELERVLASVQGDSHRDLRDHAILLLLAHYGLRIGEIARLRLEDVNWGARRLALRRRKGGRDLALPLLAPVEHALARYILEARPRGTRYREIFLSRYLPHPYPAGSNLGMTLGWRLRKLGVSWSPHALRHTLAGGLLSADCPPERIQILLGHARFDTTRIYAKVDLAHLREVADNNGVDS